MRGHCGQRTRRMGMGAPISNILTITLLSSFQGYFLNFRLKVATSRGSTLNVRTYTFSRMHTCIVASKVITIMPWAQMTLVLADCLHNSGLLTSGKQH